MTTVSLSNQGLIPLEAITTMGINVKEGKNPIGFFGTGLKYAIASLLRSSHKITIFRGLDRYDFSVQTSAVRGKDFDFIVMRGPEGEQRLGFTTHLGAKWEMWQVFRELYSNCLDEAGELSFVTVAPEDGWTTIRVTGEAFGVAARDRDRFFLSTPPLYHGPLVDIHPGPSNGLYYRGVLAARLEHTSAFTYNLTTAMDLTEDRTLSSRWMADIYIGVDIAKCTDRKLLERLLVTQHGYEASLGFHNPNEIFGETVLDLCERLGIGSVIHSAVKAAEGWAQKEARVKASVLSAGEAAEIADAQAFLALIGYPVTHPVIVTDSLGPDIFGMAKDGKIFIAKITLTRGGNFLIGTLLEEQLHLSQGFTDESRRFQDFLIDLVVKFAKDAAYAQRKAA